MNSQFNIPGEKVDWNFRATMLLIAALLASVLALIFTVSSINETKDYSHVESLTLEEFWAREHRLEAVLQGPVVLDPQVYFGALTEAHRLDQIAEKLSYDSSVPREAAGPLRVMQVHNTMLVNDMVTKYQDVFRRDDFFRRAGEHITPVHSLLVWDIMPAAGNGTRALRAASAIYLVSTFIALLFFVTRLLGEKMRIWPELPNIVFSAVLWPVRVWFYPRYVDPIEQLRRLARMVGAFMAGAISLGTMAAAASAQTRDKDESGADTGNVLVVTDLPKPVQSLVSYSAATGIMTDKVAANGTIVHHGPVSWASASASFDNGWSFGYWGSRSFSAPRGSDENDYSVTRSWKGSWSPSVTLAYYDIQPIDSAKGGDMISPIFKISHPLGFYGLTGFGQAEFYELTHGSARRNGWDGSVGVNGAHSFELPHGLGHAEISESLSVVTNDGPFTQRAGTLVRSDTALKVPLWKQVSGAISVKIFEPMFGAKDRTHSTTLGLGLMTSF